jgi:uncharacterized protein (DUF924 family)
VYQDILQFWFEEISPAQWWKVDAAFDQQIRDRFGEVLKQAAEGGLSDWRKGIAGRLAEIILLDQFSRNCYRGTPQAFAQDGMALVLAQEAIRAGVLTALNPVQRSFLLLPFMHSESARIHVEAERLYREHAPLENYQFELKHKAIIDRFGRYPHRNAILGRESSADELAFLQLPGSSF